MPPLQQTEQQRQATFQAAGMQPAATAPVTPTPQIQTPAAPTPTPAPVQVNVGTQPAPQVTQQPTQQPTQGPLTMPSSGSVVDLLNSAGQASDFESRKKLAEQYGIAGYTGTGQQNVDLSKKYLDAYNAQKNQPVPETGAAARSALDNYFNENLQHPQEDPQKAFFDNYMAMNPVVKTMYDTIQNELSHPVTTQSFKDEFDKLRKDQDIPELNTQLMNIKNIMDGTEDDIRNEITKAGGFATDSQVQALAAARNKTLLKQANVLQQQLALKNDYVDQIMQFSEKDRAEVDKEVEKKLGLTEKLAKIQETMTNASKENYKNIIDKVGFSGLAEALGNDKKAMSQAERFMGLPAGALSDEAFLALEKKKELKPLQFVSGTENQASGVFDPNTGKFTARGGGGGTGGGYSAAVTNNPALQTALTTILGSGTFTKQQQANVTNAIRNGEDPFTVVKNQAKNVMGQTLATNLSNNEKARAAIQDLDIALKQYYANGGKTNVFAGNYEEAVSKVGEINDPKLRELATQIEASLQIYRNAVSGTAYSVQEGKAIAAIFPGINKSEGLNQAIIKGRMRAFDSVIDESYGQVLGDQTYQALKQSEMQKKNTLSPEKGSMSNAEFVSKSVESSGRSYNSIVSSAPKGQIAVAENSTGKIGYIPAEDFNNSQYTRL